MKLLYLLAIMLLAFMVVCAPASTWAESINPQTLLAQNTPAANQDPQTAEMENSADGVPELFIPENSYRFEPVPAGQTVTHDFVVHNKGTALLHITRVKTG